jgi:hypothetical protein
MLSHFQSKKQIFPVPVNEKDLFKLSDTLAIKFTEDIYLHYFR